MYPVRNSSAPSGFATVHPIQTLGPGLTEQLVFAWQVPEAAAQALQEVTIRVWKKKFTRLMVTYGGKEWIDTDNYVRRSTKCTATS